MPINLRGQLCLLLLCLLSGYPAGILYDFFRTLRRTFKSPILCALGDMLFCCIWFGTLFIIGYTAGGGVQRLYAPAFSLLGFALYLGGLSPFFTSVFNRILTVFRKILDFLLYPLAFAVKRAKKLFIFLKNSFYSKAKCYTMKNKFKKTPDMGKSSSHSRKGTANEAEKGRYHY